MTQTHLPVKVLYSKQLIDRIVINHIISYWPSYRSSVSCIGHWPSGHLV